MIYIVFYIVLMFLLIIERSTPAHYKLVRNIIAILFTVFVGYRGINVGVDTHTYYDHYYTFGREGCWFVEPGFDYINHCFFMHNWGVHNWLLFFSFLSITPIAIGINRLKGNEYTLASFLFYGTSFVTLVNGMRQCVVCGVFFLLIFFINEHRNEWGKNIIIYTLVICISSLLHATSLLLLPVILLNYIKLPKNYYLLIYIISFAFIFIDISAIIPSFEIGNRDYSHFANEEGFHRTASLLGFTISSILNITIFFLMYKTELFKKQAFLCNLVLFSFVLKNIGFATPIIGRYTMYFAWFVILVCAKLYSEENGNRIWMKPSWIIIIAITVAIQINAIFSDANKLLPYNFYWEDTMLIYND